MKKSVRGFTLIELVIVIAIIGILASLAIPKFIDMSGSAKIASTKAGLGSLRAALATKYAASATGGATASYPTQLAATDFASGDGPKNALNTRSGVTGLFETTTGVATSGSVGFWYISASTSPDYGKAGAYSDGTGTDTSSY
jgi:prepilin-type N-terminal cleavage/methylation domain-containing protein